MSPEADEALTAVSVLYFLHFSSICSHCWISLPSSLCDFLITYSYFHQILASLILSVWHSPRAVCVVAMKPEDGSLRGAPGAEVLILRDGRVWIWTDRSVRRHTGEPRWPSVCVWVHLYCSHYLRERCFSFGLFFSANSVTWRRRGSLPSRPSGRNTKRLHWGAASLWPRPTNTHLHKTSSLRPI